MNPELERLDPRYVSMSSKAGAMWSAIMGIVWLALILALGMGIEWSTKWWVIALGVWGALTALHAWWYQYRPRLAYRHSSYRIDAEGIEIRKGALFRSIITVPRSRVQHTDVSQGPYERRHGLGTLQIYTAGVAYSQVSLEGLPHARALEIRDALLPRERATGA